VNTPANTIDWLLDADPAISWQAMRDVAGSSASEIAAQRARIPREGIGAAILASQQADGAWRCAGKPVWLPTLFTLLLLRATGVDPTDAAVKEAITRAECKLCWSNRPNWELRAVESGGNAFFAGEVEPCINGGVLALGGYFGRPSESLAHRLLNEQLGDGGWNCEAPKSARSSFHTTICVLEGLLEYERAAGCAPEIAAARQRGEEYLLRRTLFRRLSTGEVANPEFLEFAFPPRYHYDILRALDYFRNAGVPPDTRMSDAVQFVASRQRADGRWLLDRACDEALAVPLGEPAGEPSGWNTLRALRVLRWYDGEAAA
jgi:hypothetical protein